MRRAMMMAGVLAVVFVAGVAAAAGVPVREGRPCRMADGRPVLFTVVMGERAGRAVWRGVRRVGLRERRMLARIERCQRNPRASGFVRGFDRRLARGHRERVYRAEHPPMAEAVASVYDAAGGPIACGGDSYAMGVANRTLACGTRLLICYSGCVHAIVFDRGPYVARRDFDLSRAVEQAISFPDGVATIRYAVR